MSKKQIGFIGAGNMASAIINGLLKSNYLDNNDLYISDCDKNKLEDYTNQGINTYSDNNKVIENSDFIFIAVKPNIYPIVLKEISKNKNINKKVLITIAPGITIDFVKSFFKQDIKVIRSMPNTPALVGKGMTVICSKDPVEEEDLKISCEIFNKVGSIEIIEEKYINKFVALNGSSPAYIYIMIEAMADAAVLQGIPRNVAYNVAAKSVSGAAEMVLQTQKHPGELKDMVCSPGGTTIEAVYSLEKSGFRASVIEAMNKCTEKAENMVK